MWVVGTKIMRKRRFSAELVLHGMFMSTYKYKVFCRKKMESRKCFPRCSKSHVYCNSFFMRKKNWVFHDFAKNWFLWGGYLDYTALHKYSILSGGYESHENETAHVDKRGAQAQTSLLDLKFWKLWKLLFYMFFLFLHGDISEQGMWGLHLDSKHSKIGMRRGWTQWAKLQVAEKDKNKCSTHKQIF